MVWFVGVRFASDIYHDGAKKRSRSGTRQQFITYGYSSKREFPTSQVVHICAGLSSLKTRPFSTKQPSFGSHLTVEVDLLIGLLKQLKRSCFRPKIEINFKFPIFC